MRLLKNCNNENNFYKLYRFVKTHGPSENDFIQELETIRTTLLHYRNDKKRLRTLREQLSTLTQCADSLDEDSKCEVQYELAQVKQGIPG